MSIRADMKLLIFFTFLFSSITEIFGQCHVELSEDPLLQPKIFLVVGLRKIAIPIPDNTTEMSFFNNQKILIQCETLIFDNYHGTADTNEETIECKRRDTSVYYECLPKWKLYESAPNFTWCENNMTSYILARLVKYNNPNSYEYLGGICYDTFTNSFKSLYYSMGAKHVDNLHPDVLAKFYTPVYEIEHYRDIFHKRSFDYQDYDNDVFRDWMKYSQYNFSSILQNPVMTKQFSSILDVVWWPSLRLGNWKIYEMGLEKYIEKTKQSFDILAGVSDVVKAPITEGCNTNFSLVNFNDNVNRQIPFYVWNYLQARDKSFEIVIIGVNSPFYEFYAVNDVIFCLDKCQEIPWLKAKSSTFRYSALGIIFCCSVDDVRKSKRLDGFPETTMDSSPFPPTSSLYEYISTTTIASEYEDNDDNDDN